MSVYTGRTWAAKGINFWREDKPAYSAFFVACRGRYLALTIQHRRSRA